MFFFKKKKVEKPTLPSFIGVWKIENIILEGKLMGVLPCYDYVIKNLSNGEQRRIHDSRVHHNNINVGMNVPLKSIILIETELFYEVFRYV